MPIPPRLSGAGNGSTGANERDDIGWPGQEPRFPMAIQFLPDPLATHVACSKQRRWLIGGGLSFRKAGSCCLAQLEASLEYAQRTGRPPVPPPQQPHHGRD